MAIKVTEEQFEYLEDNYYGLCISCGFEQEGVEPDGRKYECDECGKHAVYGIHELLISGKLTVVEDSDVVA